MFTQVHRRLTEQEVSDLVEAYTAGITLNQLSQPFKVRRTCLSNALERRGVPRRYRMMEGHRLVEAISAYRDGKSLATIGLDLGVSGDTVRNALLKGLFSIRRGAVSTR